MKHFIRTALFVLSFGLCGWGVSQVFAATKKPPAAAIQVKPVVSTYGNWQVACPPVGDTTGVRCFAELSVIDPKRKIAVVDLRIGYNQQQALLADLQTPAEVLVAPGATLSLGGGAQLKLAYVSCGVVGCRSAALLKPDFLKAAKAAQEAIVSVVAINGKVLQVKLKINGIAEALAAITQTK
jgi:invasion protein IalB